MSKKTYIVAELGTAHQGDLKKAEKLIKAAVHSGADCAKFQIVFADEIIHKNTGIVPLPGGDTPLYEVFKNLEQDFDFYKSLKEICLAESIDFMASPFGEKSAQILSELGERTFKIASPELNHYPLLKQIKSYNSRFILSSGVSTLGDIERALSITGIEGNTLLHCITSYPAPPEEYNLKLITHYRKIFNIDTGVSDHSKDPILVPTLSVSQGATLIEKHFALSNLSDGLDDPIALEPDDFQRMVDSIRKWENKEEKSIIKGLKKDYNDELIEAILGDGVKRLAAAEKANYGRTNRSLHALKALKKGTVLSKENCAILRTEKILKPGLSPFYFDDVLGTKVQRDIPDGEGINWQDLLT